MFLIHQGFINTLKKINPSKHRKSKKKFKIDGQEVATFPSL